MLSEKTKSLLSQFLQSLKEDTGLEPESMDFWQYDHRGNTNEKTALTLINAFDFEKNEFEHHNSATKQLEHSENLDLRFYYLYKPTEVCEDCEEETHTCKECEDQFAPDQMSEHTDLCLPCQAQLMQMWRKEKEAEQREWERSR